MATDWRPAQASPTQDTPNFSRKPIKRKPVQHDRRSLSSGNADKPLLASSDGATPDSVTPDTTMQDTSSPMCSDSKQHEKGRLSSSSENLKADLSSHPNGPIDVTADWRNSDTTLVSNFAPLSVTESRPTVLRSYSGNHFMSSTEVISRFRRLLDTQHFRLEKSNLTSLLGVEPNSKEALLEPLEPQLYMSRDGRYIVTRPELESIAQTLRVAAIRYPVDLHAFAAKHDISWHSLQKMIETYAGKDWPRVILDVDDWSYLVSHEQVERIKARLVEVMQAASSEVCNLSAAFDEDIPSPVIVALATEASFGKDCQVRYAGEHVMFVPAGRSQEDIALATQQHSNQLDAQQRSQLVDVIEDQLWCPLHLYTAGVNEIVDQDLRQRQEQYVTDYFRRERIPRTIAVVHQQNLGHNVVVADAIDRLHRASAEVKSFAGLQGVVIRLGQDLSIEAPDGKLVFQTKHRHIAQTVQSMQHMIQGMDILLNLLWILLATSGPGLFISSVRDTTKLIRQHDEIGDPEITGMLNLWLNKLDKGINDDEDIRQMKELARCAEEEWREGEACNCDMLR